MPSTAVGDGDWAGGEGDEAGGKGDEPGGAVVDAGGALTDADAVWVGAPDGGTEGEGDAAWEGEDVGDGEALAATLGDAVTEELAEGVGLAWPGAGPSATGRGWAASTAAPRATSPRIATSGTSATLLPSGRSSKQLGQKPETGIVT